MKKILFVLITLFTTFQLFAAEEAGSSTGVDRYAIYIGCNDGGKERDKLLYASTDAQNFQKIMSEIGGVQDSNSYILIDPTKERIDDTLAKISSKIDSNKMNAKRSEFIFYYSGHSDEESILLGETAYDYSTLKHAISDVPSDIHIVILDSCYSGNFIRTKGGQKKKPFLMDDSSVVKGHAYLSSSSAREYSQESDDIESSYFTNAMITGLRGAADTSGDSKVTLNELYSYAFNDTLSKTESSKAGPQHPNFNITLVGSGDLILSDISNADAMLSISKEAKGTFIIRDSDGKLISEINKTAGQPILMALPVGMYSAVCIDEYSTRQGTFTLSKNSVYVLDQNNLFSVQQKDTTLKGGSILADEDSDETYISENQEDYQSQDNFNIGDPFHLFVVPGLPLFRFTRDCSLLSLGMIGSSERCMFGVQASGVMNINSGKLIGVQAAGVFNIVNNDVLGFQTAGVFDIARNVEGGQAAGVFNIARSGFGVQGAGVFNISSGSFKGVQGAGVFNVASEIKGVQVAGVFNVAKKVDGLQLGVVNVAKENNGLAIGLFNFIGNGMHHFGITWNLTDNMTDLFYQSGTKNFYITVGVSYADKFFSERASDIGLSYAGIGTEFRAKHASIDIELLTKSVINIRDAIEITVSDNSVDIDVSDSYEQNFIPSLRVTANWLWGKHFEVSAGASTDLHIIGVNDAAFATSTHNKKVSWWPPVDDTELYYSFFVGVKWK
jgi:hypothetical protein